MEIRAHNREAWDREVARGNRWTVPVSSEVIRAARAGRWDIVLTPTKPVPRTWFPDPLAGRDVLCLASGGGQQAPVLAAAGAHVTVLDNSPRQLEQDALVAARDGLTIRTLEGDMTAMPQLEDEAFDVVVHPVSNLFVPDVVPVWQEAFRVLRPGGRLLAGFVNPSVFLFDPEQAERTGVLQVRHAIPYADTDSLDEEALDRRIRDQRPLEHGHTLAAQIGGQLAAGFRLIGLYEDRVAPGPEDLLEHFMDTCIATCAVKP